MIKKILFFIVSVFIVITVLYVIQTGENDDRPLIKISVGNCNVQQKKCKVELEEFNIEISMDKSIYYLKKFNVDVWVESKQATNIESIQVDFKMKNMNMGVNHFILNKIKSENKKQNWQGNALLPVCVTGRADWFSELTVITKQNKYILEFSILVKK
ncbi:MAG: hypothetical protein KAJ39_01855 [Gammaproteobacteria bacterium]|nr:hypothetical protein [Gammaproteobacteria bacterium]